MSGLWTSGTCITNAFVLILYLRQTTAVILVHVRVQSCSVFTMLSFGFIPFLFPVCFRFGEDVLIFSVVEKLVYKYMSI